MKRIILTACFVTIVVLSGSCSTRRVDLVRIPVVSKSAIDFVRFKKVVYAPIKVKKFPSEFKPESSINYFFLKEMPKVIDKPVGEYDSSNEINEGLNEGDLLLVGGELSLNIKKRSVIREKKKKRVFVEVENWELSLEIFFKDVATGKEMFKKTLKGSLIGADGEKPDYNFEFIFRKVTEKFIRVFMGLGKLETRYLLK